MLSSHSPIHVSVPSVAFTLELRDKGQGPSCAAFTVLRPDWLNFSDRKERRSAV